jgi:hypothetical protein
MMKNKIGVSVMAGIKLNQIGPPRFAIAVHSFVLLAHSKNVLTSRDEMVSTV